MQPDKAGTGSRRGRLAVIPLLLMLPMGLHLMENTFDEGPDLVLMLANLIFFAAITLVSWLLLRKRRSRARWLALAGTLLYYAGSALAMGVFAVRNAEERHGHGFRGLGIQNQIAEGKPVPDSIEVLFKGDKLWILGLPRIHGFMGRFVDVKEDRLFLGESNYTFMDSLLPRDFPAFAASKVSKPLSGKELRESFLTWQFPDHFHQVVEIQGDSGSFSTSEYSTAGERGVFYVTPLLESRKAEYWAARFKSYRILLRDLVASPYHRSDLESDPYFKKWRESIMDADRRKHVNEAFSEWGRLNQERGLWPCATISDIQSRRSPALREAVSATISNRFAEAVSPRLREKIGNDIPEMCRILSFAWNLNDTLPHEREGNEYLFKAEDGSVLKVSSGSDSLKITDWIRPNTKERS